jgi:hypothetical protein
MAESKDIIMKFQVYCEDCKNDHMEIEIPMPISRDTNTNNIGYKL